jgi:D-3-phosphoglycerate dehydrogenase
MRHEARIVLVDDHTVDAPPSRHMLVVRNEDVPGVIGRVGTILGGADVNIADMHVGRAPSGASALMVIATSGPVPAEVRDTLAASEGIVEVHALELAG